MILDRMVVYQLHNQQPKRISDQETEVKTAWLRVVATNINLADRVRVWAGTVLIEAGTALRAPVLPELASTASPCESD
ncbi:MAG: hypothetical protein ABFD24_05870 [Anaerolineaceae bacterium]|jgi:hypothetical protein